MARARSLLIGTLSSLSCFLSCPESVLLCSLLSSPASVFFLCGHCSSAVTLCVCGPGFFVGCLLFLESALGTLCTDGLHEGADGSIKV